MRKRLLITKVATIAVVFVPASFGQDTAGYEDVPTKVTIISGAPMHQYSVNAARLEEAQIDGWLRDHGLKPIFNPCKVHGYLFDQALMLAEVQPRKEWEGVWQIR